MYTESDCHLARLSVYVNENGETNETITAKCKNARKNRSAFHQSKMNNREKVLHIEVFLKIFLFKWNDIGIFVLNQTKSSMTLGQNQLKIIKNTY